MPITIQSGDVDGRTVVSVKVRWQASPPTKQHFEVTVAPTSTTQTTVSVLVPLAAGGLTFGGHAGTWWSKAWCYDSGGTLLFDTDDAPFEVAEAHVEWTG